MNLMEAVKSKKKFKRPCQLFWNEPDDLQNSIFDREDILAEDWYVQKINEVVITEELFDDALAQIDKDEVLSLEQYANEIKRKLGL